jgi:serine/threonine protein kinase/Tfp pilus assembly protein PilF
MSVSAPNQEWHSPEEPPTTVVVAADPRGENLGPLAARLVEEMAAAWRRGERPLVEHLLAPHPELCLRPEIVLRLICEEVCLRQEAEEELGAEPWGRRFPAWRAEIANMLDSHATRSRVVTAPAAAAPVPDLADFEILAELGRGGAGRVFLARQRSLADRPVVLKTTRRKGREHLSLARLQHTHIVPLYWVQDDPVQDSRTLCMPYFGSLTLAGLLATLKHTPPARRTGQDMLAALDAATTAAAAPLHPHGPARPALARASYAQAVAWMGACLAEALAYAHERGLVHLDIKPSNILVAADGQPMLLDFHLAQPPLPSGSAAPWGLGGTPLYMSPEQRAASDALSQRRPLPGAVDGRSDLYSLGLVLYQALGGSVPLHASRPPRLERRNRQVSLGLADVIHKCLAEDPSTRYATAAALAGDLRRHLASLPLRGVRNRSWGERWGKWRRRRPHALLSLGLLLLVLGGVLAGGLWYAHERGEQGRAALRQAEAALHEGQELLRAGQYRAASQRLQGGLACADTSAARELRRRLEAALQQARELESADQLHRLADAVRLAAVAESVPDADLENLERACRDLWAQRNRLLTVHMAGTVTETIRRQVRADLLDLAVVLVELRLVGGARDRAACREALRVLGETEETLGANAVLLRLRHQLAQRLGHRAEIEASARRLSPRNGWEHYALGRRLLQEGKLNEAAAALENGVRLAPGDFWAHFYQGKCAFRRGDYREAVSAFRVCTALAPTSAPAYHNRGLAQAHLQEHEGALADYTRALELDPTLAEAAVNRALLHHRQGRRAAAEADVQRALAARPGYAPALRLQRDLLEK